MKSCSICLHINLPSRMHCSPYKWFHTEWFSGLLFCLPTPFSLSLIHCAIVFLLPIAGSPPTCHLITPAQPNPVFIEMCSKKYIQLELLQLQSSQLKIFQDCQVLQFTMTAAIDQLTATCFLYNIEHSGTLI